VTVATWLGFADPPGQPPDRRPAILLEGDLDRVEELWLTVDAALRRRADYRLIIAVPDGHYEKARQRFSHERVVSASDFAGSQRHRSGIALVIDASANPQVVSTTIDGLPGTMEPADDALGKCVSALLPAFGSRRLASIAALGEALGSPETILCLGNGPSSEDPTLDRHADATLFRVNWTWRTRGKFSRPDAVFTADPDLPPDGPRPILVFPRAAGGRLVLAQHLLAFRSPRGGYLFLDELSPSIAEMTATVVPTNGALMIAVAAALEPRRLVIAGMDLYSHPDGRYPGSGAVEGYARGHGADCDLELISHALAGFSGEVEILSPNLKTALER
jgi:hypothetical protein